MRLENGEGKTAGFGLLMAVAMFSCQAFSARAGKARRLSFRLQ
jgi:hypothetical protein